MGPASPPLAWKSGAVEFHVSGLVERMPWGSPSFGEARVKSYFTTLVAGWHIQPPQTKIA